MPPRTSACSQASYAKFHSNWVLHRQSKNAKFSVQLTFNHEFFSLLGTSWKTDEWSVPCRAESRANRQTSQQTLPAPQTCGANRPRLQHRRIALTWGLPEKRRERQRSPPSCVCHSRTTGSHGQGQNVIYRLYLQARPSSLNAAADHQGKTTMQSRCRWCSRSCREKRRRTIVR